jgi:hypothetical protein
VAVALVVIGFTVPVVAVPYETAVEVQGTETYYENEPYQDIETYTVQEPYTFQEPHTVQETYQETVNTQENLKYQYNVIANYTEIGLSSKRERIVIEGVVFRDWAVYYPIACLEIFNFGTTVGTYRVHVSFYHYLPELDGTVRLVPPMPFDTARNFWKTITINPNERLTVKFPCKENELSDEPSSWKYKYGNELSSWEYEIVPNTYQVTHSEVVDKTRPITIYKPVTRYKDVEKTRTVTLYRDVQKTCPITLSSTETKYKKVSLIQSWFDK